MEPADDVDGAAKASPLYAKYGTKADRESAKELLASRLEQSAQPEEAKPEAEPRLAAAVRSLRNPATR